MTQANQTQNSTTHTTAQLPKTTPTTSAHARRCLRHGTGGP